MTKSLKWAAAALAAAVLIACQKEKPVHRQDPQTTKVPAANPAVDLMNTKILSVMYPYCTLSHSKSCLPFGGTCMLRFPPSPTTGEPWTSVRFYAPVATGQGSTGTQMALEFLSPAPGIEQGLLGPEEWDEPMIVVHQELANSLGYSSIRVVNHEYMPVFSALHPYGYVVYDCIANN